MIDGKILDRLINKSMVSGIALTNTMVSGKITNIEFQVTLSMWYSP